MSTMNAIRIASNVNPQAFNMRHLHTKTVIPKYGKKLKKPTLIPSIGMSPMRAAIVPHESSTMNLNKRMEYKNQIPIAKCSVFMHDF